MMLFIIITGMVLSSCVDIFKYYKGGNFKSIGIALRLPNLNAWLCIGLFWISLHREWNHDKKTLTTLTA